MGEDYSKKLLVDSTIVALVARNYMKSKVPLRRITTINQDYLARIYIMNEELQI